MKIIHLHRRPQEGYHSIENIYEAVRKELSSEVAIETVVMPFYCSSHLGKILNMIYVFFLRADVFHVTGDIHYVAMFLPKRKTIISCHSVEGGRPEYEGRAKKMFKWLYFVMPNKHCKFWTAVSDHTKKELLDYLGCSENKVKVVHNPVLNFFSEKKTKKKTEIPVLLQVGTHKRKNIGKLIDAISGLECELWIVGEPPKDIVAKLEMKKINHKVIPTATAEEMNVCYNKADVVVMVSLEESFGMPIVEAQSVGVPVVVSDVSAMPEIGGQGVCYVNPGEAESIKEGIVKVLENEGFRKELVEKGFGNVKRFDLEFISKQYLEIYRAV